MKLFQIVLDVIAFSLVGSLFLAGFYELIAMVWNAKARQTPDNFEWPYITWIVRPWIFKHRQLALGITALIVGGLFWLFFHFFF